MLTRVPLHTTRCGVPHLQPCEVPACQHLQQGGWLAPIAWVPLLHQLEQAQYMQPVSAHSVFYLWHR